MVRSERIEIPGFSSDASRCEFCCFRCIYAIPLCIIGGFVSLFFVIAISFLTFFNFILIVIFGKRIESLYNLILKMNTWQIRINMYFAGTTDERPPLTPC